MAETAREFFETLEERANRSRANDLTASYLFVIDGAGTWKVDVKDGKVEVTEGGAGADCTIKASERTFDRIVSGKQNALTAYMTGKIKVEGDMAQAMKLQKLL